MKATLLPLLMVLGVGYAPCIAADPEPAAAPLTAAEAKALALKVHAATAAMDSLPRFYYRIKSGNAVVDTMRARDDLSVEGLKEALDGPVADVDFLQWGVTFAWTEKHAYWGNGDHEGPRFGEAGKLSRQDRVWTKDLAFERNSTADQPARFVYTRTAKQLWEMQLCELAYFRVTPHRFWWATSQNHIDNLSLVPPEEADYRYVRTELFDDVLCDVIESFDRAERLWIRRITGRLHGVLAFRPRGGAQDPFFDNERVRKIAGRSFATLLEYSNWYSGDSITPEQKTEIAQILYELQFDSLRPNELIRFRDYRQVAPGVWIPFREDRAFTHSADGDPKRYKYIRLWVAVQEVKTDIDLSDTVESLLPKEGEAIQDQRFGVVVNYNFQRDRTQGQFLELIETERNKQRANSELLNRAIAPIKALVGKPAPELPTDGWVGGPPPKLVDQPYLVHFWATWCGPCKNDLRLLKELAAEGITVVGMHPAGTPAEDIAKVIDDRELRYPTYVASAKADGDERKIGGYPVAFFPYCILVDGTGRIVGHGSLGPELLVKLRSLRSK